MLPLGWEREEPALGEPLGVACPGGFFRSYRGVRAWSGAVLQRRKGRVPHNPACGGHPFIPVHGIEQPVLHFPPSALLREVLVPCSHILWLSPSHSSQPSFPVGPGGTALQYFCCPAGRRVSTGTVGNGIQVAEGCLSQGRLPSAHCKPFLALHSFLSHQVSNNATSSSQNGQVKGKGGQDSESTKTTYF